MTITVPSLDQLFSSIDNLTNHFEYSAIRSQDKSDHSVDISDDEGNLITKIRLLMYLDGHYEVFSGDLKTKLTMGQIFNILKNHAVKKSAK